MMGFAMLNPTDDAVDHRPADDGLRCAQPILRGRSGYAAAGILALARSVRRARAAVMCTCFGAVDGIEDSRRSRSPKIAERMPIALSSSKPLPANRPM